MSKLVKVDDEIGEKFKMWFARPFDFLRHRKAISKDWDGGYIAISIGCMLCERYFRAKTTTEKPLEPGESKKRKNKGYNRRFRKEAALEFGISGVKFERFWSVYRNGVQHQGMPRKVFRTYNGVTYTYRAWISESFTDTPTEEIRDTERIILIKLSPWKFARRMIELFERDESALSVGFHHAFADRYYEED